MGSPSRSPSSDQPDKPTSPVSAGGRGKKEGDAAGEPEPMQEDGQQPERSLDKGKRGSSEKEKDRRRSRSRERSALKGGDKKDKDRHRSRSREHRCGSGFCVCAVCGGHSGASMQCACGRGAAAEAFVMHRAVDSILHSAADRPSRVYHHAWHVGGVAVAVVIASADLALAPGGKGGSAAAGAAAGEGDTGLHEPGFLTLPQAGWRAKDGIYHKHFI